jgi:cytochrome P450
MARVNSTTDSTQFGYGSRTCIGRNLATFEVYKFVGQILTHYDVELVNPEHPWTFRSLWFAELENMIIRLEKRGTSKQC